MNSKKSLPVTRGFKTRLKEYAEENRITMASMIHKVIQDYAEGRFTVEVEGPGVFDDQIRYNPPSHYDQAISRAYEEGVALTEVIRRGLAKRMN